jgi:PAS domain S-box-containing protein
MLDNLSRSKQVLRESEETAWQILDSTTDSVLLIDHRGFILASNELAAERYGMSLEQMVDTNFYDLLPEDLQASRKAQIADVIRTGRSVRFEDEREGMILDHRIYPVHGAGGEVSRIAIFARGVTTHKWVAEVSEQLGRRNELILEAAGEGMLYSLFGFSKLKSFWSTTLNLRPTPKPLPFLGINHYTGSVIYSVRFANLR